MTKGQLEDRLKALLDVPGAMMFYRDQMWTIYSPIAPNQCQGTGHTIQEAIFHCEYSRSRVKAI